jgi:replicative DNA helicase
MAQLSPVLDRIPPQALDAEQAVLGCMMIDGTRSAVEIVRDILRPGDYYREAHRRIFEAICSLDDRDEPVDILTVAGELERMGLLDMAGGRAYLTACMDLVPAITRAEAYARRVQSAAILRRLIDAGGQIIGLAYEQAQPVDEIVDEAERLVFAVGQKRTQQYFSHVKPLLFDLYNEVERTQQTHQRLTGLGTGFTRLDDMTAGLQPSDFIIIAGRPSMGKTALCLNIAVRAVSTHQVPAAIFSLEMSRHQLVQRLICAEAKISSTRLRTGYFRSAPEDGGEGDLERLGRAIGRLGDLPLYVDDSPDITALEMRAKCRRLKAEHGLGLIVVDYLQLVRGHGRAENRNQEISLIARSLKSLAREMEVPVVALSQLSRLVERRDDKRPLLSDLRESGSIEAEADLVLMLYRAQYYRHEEAIEQGVEDEALTDNTAEVIVAKHRNGPTGIVRLAFLRRYACFENLAEEYGAEGRD